MFVIDRHADFATKCPKNRKSRKIRQAALLDCLLFIFFLTMYGLWQQIVIFTEHPATDDLSLFLKGHPDSKTGTMISISENTTSSGCWSPPVSTQKSAFQNLSEALDEIHHNNTASWISKQSSSRLFARLITPSFPHPPIPSPYFRLQGSLTFGEMLTKCDKHHLIVSRLCSTSIDCSQEILRFIWQKNAFLKCILTYSRHFSKAQFAGSSFTEQNTYPERGIGENQQIVVIQMIKSYDFRGMPSYCGLPWLKKENSPWESANSVWTRSWAENQWCRRDAEEETKEERPLLNGSSGGSLV